MQAIGLFTSVCIGKDLKLEPGATVVIATPGVPQKLTYENNPGGIRPLNGSGLLFGSTKHESADQITTLLHKTGFDLATCLSRELKDELTRRGLQVREAFADHQSIMGFPQPLSSSRRPAIADSEVLLDTVVNDYGFIVKKSERVRITMSVAARLDRAHQSWRSPILGVSHTMLGRERSGYSSSVKSNNLSGSLSHC